MRISDWSSDVCSSDLDRSADGEPERTRPLKPQRSAGSSQSSNARLAVPGALTGSAFVTTKRAYFQSRTRAVGGFGAMLIGLSALAIGFTGSAGATYETNPTSNVVGADCSVVAAGGSTTAFNPPGPGQKSAGTPQVAASAAPNPHLSE